MAKELRVLVVKKLSLARGMDCILKVFLEVGLSGEYLQQEGEEEQQNAALMERRGRQKHIGIKV